MHYAIWAAGYMIVSFASSLALGRLIAFGAADLPEHEPVPLRLRAGG